MFGSRRSRPSLIGRAAQTAARTAVITATATTVASKVAKPRTAGAAAAPEAMPAAAPVIAPPPDAGGGGLTPEAITQLKQIAELHSQGILTDEEFATQKARILA